MKGVYSDPTSQAWNMLFKNLMPDSTYSHDSGGNPKDIPNLTWNDLKNFHKQFYHPSNAIFSFYGNANLEDELEFLHNNYLFYLLTYFQNYSLCIASIKLITIKILLISVLIFITINYKTISYILIFVN